MVAASTGLLISGRAVHPGFKGGRMGGGGEGASSKLVVGGSRMQVDARDGLLLLLGIGLMLVLMATVGMVGGGGAGLVGSARLFAWLLIGVIVKPLNWPNKLLL